MIPMKCSMHIGKRKSRKHNLRMYDVGKWNQDGHIDSSRSHMNQVLIDERTETIFEEIFGDSLAAFNEKNYRKHPERLVGFHSAKEYEKTPPEERRSKAVKAYMNKQKRNIHEGIFQLGDHNGYLQLVQQFGQEKADKIHVEYLKALYQKFVEDNPSLRVISAVIHMDEIRDGTPHLHLDYLPVAVSSRGLSTKVSMDGAMKQLGFVRKTKAKDGCNDKHNERPFIRWLNDRRAAFEDFAQAFCNERHLGIVILPSEKCVSGHEQPEVWRAREGRTKASETVVEVFGKALVKRDKKLQIEAAEQIISNAKTVAESITKTAKIAQKKADEDREAARQLSAAAQLSIESANAFQKKARENALEYRKKAAALDDTVQQAVTLATADQERRLQELEAENAKLNTKLTKERMKHHDNG